MAGDGALDVQGAIYTLLSELDPVLAAGGIFDYVAADIAFPFVRIEDSTLVPADVDGYSGTQEIIQIAVYSNQHGKKELKVIMSRIKDALHHVNLSVTDRTAQCWWDGATVQRDPDGVTHQGILRFRVLSFKEE